MALDGGDRLQLTTPPVVALNPRWSPDGGEITFFGAPPGEPHELYVVHAAGGGVRQLTHSENGSAADDGNWSSDGASLVFGAEAGDPSLDARHRLVLETTDVKTQRVTKLPGSEGLWSPRWSPEGRYVAAMGFPNRLWLYDVQTRTSSQLTTTGVGWPAWSRDSAYLYFQDNAGTDWQPRLDWVDSGRFFDFDKGCGRD